MNASASGPAILDETPDVDRHPSGEAILLLPSLGDVIPRYGLRRLLAVRGWSVVHGAHHLALDRRMALKLPKPEIDVRADVRSRLSGRTRLPAVCEASTETFVPLAMERPAEERTRVSGVRAISSRLATHPSSAVPGVASVPVVASAPTADEAHRIAADPTLILSLPARAMDAPTENWSRRTELAWLAGVFLAVAWIALGWLVSLLAA